MSGRSPLVASEDQHAALRALAGSRDRGEADRARAVLLTLAGWTSPRIAEAVGVREDTVRLWRPARWHRCVEGQRGVRDWTELLPGDEVLTTPIPDACYTARTRSISAAIAIA